MKTHSNFTRLILITVLSLLLLTAIGEVASATTYRVDGYCFPAGSVISLDNGVYGTVMSGSDGHFAIERTDITTDAGHGLTLSASGYQTQYINFNFGSVDHYYDAGTTYLAINPTPAPTPTPTPTPKPVASFVGSPTSGVLPLTVQFTDQSTNSPTSWSWNFGDSGTSTSQNPTHTYNAVGTYSVSLTATNGGGSNTYTRTGYITVNSGMTYNFSSSSYTVDDTVGTLTITVTRNLTGSIGSVSYVTADGTAIAGTDYTASNGILNFAVGQDTTTFTVPIIFHSPYHGDKSFTVALSGPYNGSLKSPSSATVTINDTNYESYYNFSASTYTVLDNQGTITITVKRLNTDVAGSIDYTTADMGAKAGIDYTAASGTLDFAVGQTTKTFDIPILTRNTYYGDRAFTVALSNSVNGTLSMPSSSTVTIYDTHYENYVAGNGYTYVYVLNTDGNSVCVLNPYTYQKVTDINMNGRVSDIAINPAGTTMYVSYSNKGYIDVYNTIDYSFESRILLTNYPGHTVGKLAISADGTTIYATLPDEDKVVAIDATTDTVTYTATITGKPKLINYYNSVVYVTTYATSANVYKLDKITLTSLGTITGCARNPQDATIDKNNNLMYIANDNGTITKIDLSAYSVSAYLNVGSGNTVYGLATNTTGYLFASNYGGTARIAIFNQAGSLLSNITAGYTPTGLVYNNLNRTLYVCGYSDNLLYVITPDNTTSIGTLMVGNRPIRVLIATQASPATQLVQFKLTTLGFIGLSDVPCSVYYNGMLTYTGITDNSGIVSFYMNPISTYNLIFNSTKNGVYVNVNIAPANTFYSFDVPFDAIISAQLGNVISPQVLGNNSQIIYTQSAWLNKTTGTGYINGTYSDTGAGTDIITFQLYQNNSTTTYNPVPIASKTIQGMGGSYNFTVPNAAGNSYYVQYNAALDTGSNMTFYQAVTFPGPKWLAGLFPLEWYFWLGFVPVLFILGAGTVTKKGWLGLVACVGSALFTIGGWYQLYVPDVAMWMAISFAFLFSIGMIIIEGTRYK